MLLALMDVDKLFERVLTEYEKNERIKNSKVTARKNRIQHRLGSNG